MQDPLNRADASVCAVIGHPIGHSLSPAIHNAAFRALDLNVNYVAFDVEEVAPFLAGFRAAANFNGRVNTVTVVICFCHGKPTHTTSLWGVWQKPTVCVA